MTPNFDSIARADIQIKDVPEQQKAADKLFQDVDPSAAAALLKRVFKSIDGNNNGFVSASESAHPLRRCSDLVAGRLLGDEGNGNINLIPGHRKFLVIVLLNDFKLGE